MQTILRRGALLRKSGAKKKRHTSYAALSY
jgi:hypothetical protein